MKCVYIRYRSQLGRGRSRPDAGPPFNLARVVVACGIFEQRRETCECSSLPLFPHSVFVIFFVLLFFWCLACVVVEQLTVERTTVLPM